MRNTVIGCVLVAISGLAAMQFANSRSEQTRVRADRISKEVPKSADDSRVLNDNIVAYTTANEALIAARKKARETLPRFISLMKSGMEGTFTVKFPLTQNGKTEHIWLQVDDIRGASIVGRLANAPVHGANYKIGQTITVASADVEDWMVRTSNAIYGGYTARYQLKDLPKQQAERLSGMFRD